MKAKNASQQIKSQNGAGKQWVDGCEQVVLSAVMNGTPDLPVASDDFGSEANRLIFNRLTSLPASNRGLLAITETLRTNGQLDKVGGAAYITDVSVLPHDAGNLKYALEQVLEAAKARRASEIGSRLRDGAVTAEQAQAELAKLTGRDRAGISIRRPSEILAIPPDERACFLGDRLFGKGKSLGVCGPGGIGKSRLVNQLAVASITGRDWGGISTHARDSRWLFLQTENSNERLRRDLEAQKRWAGKDWRRIDDRLFIHTLETDTDGILFLSDPDNISRLTAAVRELNPDVVVIDPLRDFAIGDLNSDRDMADTLRELGRITRAGNPDRGLVVVHHSLTGKAGAAKAFGLERAGFGRNSKVLHGWARGMVNVIPGAEDDNATLILTCGKNSDGREFPPVAVRLNAAMIYEVYAGLDVAAWRDHLTGATKRRAISADVLRDLRWPESGLEKNPLVKLVIDQVRCGRSRAYELIGEGLRLRVLRLNKTTGTYALT